MSICACARLRTYINYSDHCLVITISEHITILHLCCLSRKFNQYFQKIWKKSGENIKIITGVSNHLSNIAALSLLLLQLLVTKATGTFMLPSLSFNLLMARMAGSKGLRPLANTPSTSNNIPKSGCSKKKMKLPYTFRYIYSGP